MKNALIKSIALMGLVSSSVLSTTAQAANDGVLVFQHFNATLTCATPATCGNYTDTQPIKVYRKSTNEMRLYWKYNVPAGIPGGPNKAYTIGAACPNGYPETNMRAEWTLQLNSRPSSAVAYDCNGIESTYTISYSTNWPDCPLGATKDSFGDAKLPPACF